MRLPRFVVYGLAVILGASCSPSSPSFDDETAAPVDYVNILMGTDSKYEFSNGNTYPAIARPWGMNFWTPVTNTMGNGWAYQYDADKIRGFKQTHQPSPWMNDYGQFVIMPVTGEIRFHENERLSWFNHKSEVATPYYYSVYLADHHTTVEITPTERAARFRITFHQTDSAHVVVDALDMGSMVEVDAAQGRIVGYTTKNRGGVPENFRNYFVIEFDRPIAGVSAWSDGELAEGQSKAESNHAGAVVSFSPEGSDFVVNARVASSFISPEQALLNLEELHGDFEAVKREGEAVWNDVLGRVTVEGGSIDQLRTFYSCLYRTVLFPRKFYEITAEGDTVHYSPYNGQVLPGTMYTDTGFWDTFRALFPFLNLMYPSVNREIQEGLANAYKESGWLPEWGSPGLRNVMIGNNSASVVSDAWIKGLRGYDIETLYEALRHGSENGGPLTAVGRAGAQHYVELGYVPYDVGIRESAARTLEYAYDDFTIYQLAKALDRPQEEIDLYAERSQNYRKLFDPSTGLMRGRNLDGSFQEPFNPFKWGDAFTEGNSWHYTWSVFHDVQGLIELMGGDQAFVAKLDSVFSLPPIFDESYYGIVIHEITEMVVADMGQYAHGNQPIQHMIYLYNHAGAPWKAQYWVRETMDRMYKPTPDGYCGDEDNGQTSAWYVFSALGFYPVTPGVQEYVIGAPLFKKATLKLENGEEIVISAPENSAENRYVSSLKVNGAGHDKNWLSHETLMGGAIIEFGMASQPNMSRGTSKESAPYSMSREQN